MTMITSAGAPAAGSRYRKQSTGRTWRVDRVTEAELISVTEEYYGADCDVREYVPTDELSQEFAPAT